MPEPIVTRIEALLDGDRPGDDFAARPPYADAVRELLDEHAPVTGEASGPCFAIESLGSPPAGDVVRIEGPRRELLAGFAGWELREPNEVDARQPCFGVVDGDRAVSVCFSARRPGAAAEAGVDTLENHRQRGYATRVVHAWAAELLRQGRVPLYSTSWDNVASRAMARRLGMRLYAVSWGLD